MKKLALLLSILTNVSFACQVGGADRPSVHGMLLVGESEIYLSHLPMFHSPHDYQVILNVEIDKEALNIYKKQHQDSSETVYTLVPETFVLPEMIKNPKPFTAKIYQGHFERGGILIAENVAVKIKKVVYFKKFEAKNIEEGFSKYIVFGNQTEQFMAHLITSKPDFDQVIKIKPIQTTKGRVIINFAQMKVKNPIAVPHVLEGVFEGFDPELDLQTVETLSNIYLETGDLSF
jgi:hypothetical protein